MLYAGRLTKEKGVDLLADGFLRAHRRDPRLHLLLAGGGPEEGAPARAPGRARHVPRLARPRAARACLRERRRVPVLFANRHLRPGDRRGAGERPAGRRRRRGRPALADPRPPFRLAGGPDADEVAAAVAQLAASPFLRERLSRSALADVRGRTWDAAFEQLAAGYDRVLARSRRTGGPALGGDPVAPGADRPRCLTRRLRLHPSFTARRRRRTTIRGRPMEPTETRGERHARARRRRQRLGNRAGHGSHRPGAPGPLLQPRALVAGLQRPGPAARRGRFGAAAGADQVLRDLGVEPGRVLHGAGREPRGQDRGGPGRARAPTACR